MLLFISLDFENQAESQDFLIGDKGLPEPSSLGPTMEASKNLLVFAACLSNPAFAVLQPVRVSSTTTTAAIQSDYDALLMEQEKKWSEAEKERLEKGNMETKRK